MNNIHFQIRLFLKTINNAKMFFKYFKEAKISFFILNKDTIYIHNLKCLLKIQQVQMQVQ